MGTRNMMVMFLVLCASSIIISPCNAQLVRDKPCSKNDPKKQTQKCAGLSFVAAAQKGELEEMKEVLDKAVNPNYILTFSENFGYTNKRTGYTALTWAAEKNYTDIIKFLVEKEPSGTLVKRNTTIMGFTALYFLAKNVNEEGVRIMLDKGADVNAATTRGYTPLLMAAWNQSPNIVKLLLDNNANPNTAAKQSGYFPLYFGAKFGKLDIVNDLIKAKANVNLQTLAGESALAMAVSYGQEPVVTSLLAASADPNKINNIHVAPLHRACYYGYINILKKLTAAKADVNQQDEYGKTPLHYCATGGQLASLEALLQTGCPDKTIIDNEDKTPLEAAMARKEILNKKRKTPANIQMLSNMDKIIAKLDDYTATCT